MDSNKKKIWLEHGGFLAVILIIGLFIQNTYYLQILTFIGINTLLALGLNMLMGYAGQVSLGHAAFYGIGAYTTAILSATFGISPWLALGCATGVAVFIAFVVGLPTLKLSGYYLGMGTLGFGMIVNILFREWAGMTGGASGFVGIPPGGRPGQLHVRAQLFLPGLGCGPCGHPHLPPDPGLPHGTGPALHP